MSLILYLKIGMHILILPAYSKRSHVLPLDVKKIPVSFPPTSQTRSRRHLWFRSGSWACKEALQSVLYLFSNFFSQIQIRSQSGNGPKKKKRVEDLGRRAFVELDNPLFPSFRQLHAKSSAKPFWHSLFQNHKRTSSLAQKQYKVFWSKIPLSSFQSISHVPVIFKLILFKWIF